ncbi:FliM/FliN family flagellar motor switch protein [Pseudomonas plecoglossicida]|uniref:Flagellar motor switch protein FliN-like C-terminal domain-containing protein n=1 Tax=Pseudomonas plecoglossicida TaxID=70775 RepID=A0AAD0VW19_PSEDL|nr:FliM/FliN family flagellar motor switch protein [Pseudomonas plecoglossicida]AXM98865.1 hypothetical protein DVB73_25235 [Pseudomonas plecoglossicida]EPB95233.1 surface presentation of antigens (SPOA) protein [Pseudomonas plecoglossicida NB2011]QLB55013.1 FliM/FliN family flagellar motor switch protein [Pseudomonas plecoglossicida]
MIGHKKVLHRVPVEHLTFLKPEKLGRNYHKVPEHIKWMTGKHPRAITDYVLSHYRINVDMRDIRIQEHFTELPECRYRSAIGNVGFSIERPLLAEFLESYYGGTTLLLQDTPPVSASENRMRERLGVDIAKICVRLLLSGTPLDDFDASISAYEEVLWSYRIEFVCCSLATGAESSIYLYLDSQVADELTRRLTDEPSTLASDGAGRRITQLPVQLDCVLASTQMPLSDVLALQLGDILMARLLDRCEVHIKQQKLFYGAISEDNGALFLTSLDSVKNQ